MAELTEQQEQARKLWSSGDYASAMHTIETVGPRAVEAARVGDDDVVLDVACGNGNATIPGTPSLAGQPVYFTHWQLIKYRDGRRKDQQMSPFAQALSDTDMADLAAYYAAQRPRPRPATTDPAKVAEGKRLANLHHCASCHRPDLSGQQQVPRLAGQDYAYLLRLLSGFKAKTASDLDGTMTMAAQPLREEEIVALVHYMASLGSQP